MKFYQPGVPKSSPKIFFCLLVRFYLISLYLKLKANHNKDYSVVKTFKAAQVAFFIFKIYFSPQRILKVTIHWMHFCTQRITKRFLLFGWISIRTSKAIFFWLIISENKQYRLPCRRASFAWIPTKPLYADGEFLIRRVCRLPFSGLACLSLR